MPSIWQRIGKMPDCVVAAGSSFKFHSFFMESLRRASADRRLEKNIYFRGGSESLHLQNWCKPWL